VEPAAPNVIFATSSLGLTRSTDFGETWKLVAGGDTFSILAFDLVAQGTLYFGRADQLSRSTENGDSFVRVSSLPDQAALYVLASDPHRAGVLYAGTSAGIYQSSDSGSTWSRKLAGVTTALVADPNSDAFYANPGGGTVKFTNGSATASPAGPAVTCPVRCIRSEPVCDFDADDRRLCDEARW
jgi:photosystem II stability/assembly factor-like uncharacterized protein